VSKTNALQGLSDGAHVQGEGMVSWTLRDDDGAIKHIKNKSLFVPLAKVCLLSPQTLFQEQGAGSMELTSTSLWLHLHTGNYKFRLDSFSNLPMVNNASHGADNPDTVVGVTRQDVAHLSTISTNDTLSCLLSVADDNNRNLTGPQRELLLLHHKLGHADIQRIQRLCRPVDDNTAAILVTKHATTGSCV
jgi:hypothetical protein